MGRVNQQMSRMFSGRNDAAPGGRCARSFWSSGTGWFTPGMRPWAWTALLWLGVLSSPGWLQAQSTTPDAKPPDQVQRGAYLFRATGNCGCHTVPATEKAPAGPFLAGGRAVHTPFGIYYSTNLTPDPETGLGRWREEDFLRAMMEGVSPTGQHYFPAFPYTSFTHIHPDDLRAMWAYLRPVPPVRQANRPHGVWPPCSWRWPLGVWKWLNFRPGEYQPRSDRGESWNRGAYLVQALGHCGECHSPRDLSGGLKMKKFLTGGEHLSPKPVVAANLTPDVKTGLGGWSNTDLVWLLQTGFRPNGNDVQGVMLEMIENGYQHLTREDLHAIGEYLLSLPPAPGLSDRKE